MPRWPQNTRTNSPPRGFVVDRIGPTTLAIREVPALLAGQDVAAVLRDALADLGQHGATHRIAERQNELLANIACHSAVRAHRDSRCRR